MRRVSVDTGGTSTDRLDENGAIGSLDAAGLRPDPTSEFLDRLNKAVAHHPQSFAKRLGQMDRLIHATTLAANGLVERRGGKGGLSIFGSSFRSALSPHRAASSPDVGLQTTRLSFAMMNDLHARRPCRRRHCLLREGVVE
ncbi:MAG: hypothetical protein IT536_10225 [Hyphomicrobiales bacterium]|nr:hypothetical protein [Hyphomicrobiales bacterium]